MFLEKIVEMAEHMPDSWELVLDLRDEQGSERRVCHYYFVNCSNRTLFWLHDFDVEPLLSGLSHINSMRRIRESKLPFQLTRFVDDP